MNAKIYRQMPPNARDSAMARAAGQALSRHVGGSGPLKLRISDAQPAEAVELPAGAVGVLMQILEAMAAGRGVAVILENAELSTDEASEVLNVSRPFLIGLLDEKKIPYRKVGGHRRIRMEDIITYKSSAEQDAEAAIDQLVTEAQEQNMGYGPCEKM